MKRKIVSMLLVTALTVSTLAGCGGNDAAGDSGSDASGTPAESGTAADGSGTAVEDTAEAADTAEKTDSGQAESTETMSSRSWRTRRSPTTISPSRARNCMSRRSPHIMRSILTSRSISTWWAAERIGALL